MKLVIGLGNPGREYAGTRHNVGFAAVEMLAQAPGTGRWQQRHAAEVAEGQEGEEKVLYVKPQTYMNRSGQSVRQIVDFYKVPLTDLLVVADDVNLPLGQLRARPDGSAGGHNGLKDIALHLGTIAYPRLRIGVGGPGGQDLADHVLARFRPSEQPVIEDALLRAVQAAALWMKRGMEACMNQYNSTGTSKKKPDAPKPSAPEAAPQERPTGARLP